MINGKITEGQQHVISIPNEDETTDERNNKHNATPSTGKQYYDNPKGSGFDDLELIPVTSDPIEVDWTTGIRGVFLSACYMFSVISVLIFVMNFVHQRMPRNVPPLPDIGHDLIPKMEPENLGDMTMMIMVALLIVALILNRELRWPVLIRFLLTLGNMYFLRVFAVSSTSMPPTENHCRTNFVPIDNIYLNTLKGVLTLGSSNIHCGDLMFSGHTCMITNIWMSFHINFKKQYMLRIFMTIMLIITLTFIIGTRSHYTVDVYIAFVLTVLVHRSTPKRFPFTRARIRNFFKHF